MTMEAQERARVLLALVDALEVAASGVEPERVRARSGLLDDVRSMLADLRPDDVEAVAAGLAIEAAFHLVAHRGARGVAERVQQLRLEVSLALTAPGEAEVGHGG
jgi:hypothetical protein